MLFKRTMKFLDQIVLDEENRKSFQARLIYLCFAAIAFVMSLINIVTAQWVLLAATSAFCLLCVINYSLDRFAANGARVASVLFVFEVIVLFSYFVFTGGTEGFSIVWLLLLPTVGLFFFGFGKGTLMSAVMLLVMLAFFYLPGPFMREHALEIYSLTFVTRFPVLFLFSYVVSLLLEAVRFSTARQMLEARRKYQHLYNHDALTGAFNRHAINELQDQILKEEQHALGALILDIDLFKDVNDTYGHLDGDLVLKQLVETVNELTPEDTVVYRWGGEEFAVIFRNVAEAPSIAERILQGVRKRDFVLNHDTIHITVSIGLAISEKLNTAEDFDRLMLGADECLYQAKHQGRNKLVCQTL